MKFHREQKEKQGYALEIGKSGLKFQEARPQPPAATTNAGISASPPSPPSLAEDGYPVVPSGSSGVTIARNRARGQWLSISMKQFAEEVDKQLGVPVLDSTGLNAQYDVRMFWVPDANRPDANGPDFLEALEKQLGLKLTARKVPVPLVVVDAISKVPTAN